MKSLLALLGISAVLGFAAPAYADPPPVPDGDDGGFLAALHTAGISYASPDAAVAAGRAVCSCLNNGESGLELVHDVKSHNPGLRHGDGVEFRHDRGEILLPAPTFEGLTTGGKKARVMRLLPC